MGNAEYVAAVHLFLRVLRFLRKRTGLYYALGIDLKARKIHVFINSEELQGARKGEPVAPGTDSYGGSDKIKGVFRWEIRENKCRTMNIAFKF